MARVANNYTETMRYKLYGVLYHHGDSAGRGHYTVDVFHPNGDNGGGEAWLRIDDEAVSAVRQEDVFGGHGNERVQDRCAYMLFYVAQPPHRRDDLFTKLLFTLFPPRVLQYFRF